MSRRLAGFLKYGEAIHHVVTLAELVFIVKVGNINHALQVIGFSEFADDFVDLIANFFVIFQGYGVIVSPFGYFNQAVRVFCVLRLYSGGGHLQI